MVGKNKDRPELQRMMEQLRKEDIVVVLELSRFGRSISDLISLVNEIRTIGAEFVSLKESWIDTSTPQGRYFFHTAAAFAELQRELIVQATAEGLQAARARGRVGGRPKKDQNAINKAVKLYKAQTHSIKEIAEITGVSKSTLYKANGSDNGTKVKVIRANANSCHYLFRVALFLEFSVFWFVCSCSMQLFHTFHWCEILRKTYCLNCRIFAHGLSVFFAYFLALNSASFLCSPPLKPCIYADLVV